jgi:hypothetical protein
VLEFVRNRWIGWKAKFKSGNVDAQQKHLIQLYWNRVELKKELLKTLEENKSLKSQLQQQIEGRRLAEEKLLCLENTLGNHENAAHATVHFQLRLLWRTAQSMSAEFGRELVKLQEEQERLQHEEGSNALRARSMAEVEHKIAVLHPQLEQLSVQLASSAEKQSKLRWPWFVISRRKLTTEIEGLNQRYQEVQASLYRLKEDHAHLSSEQTPLFGGMSVAGRRLVNTAVLAYGEWLVVSIGSLELVTLAHQAIKKAVDDARYGSQQNCETLIALIAKSLEQLAALNPADIEFAERAKSLRQRVVYASNVESLPTAGSLGYLQQHSSASENEAVRINVLADDCWEISQVLLR